MNQQTGAIAAAADSLGGIWRTLEGHLSDRAFVTGNDLTMGDIPVGAACYRYHELAIERPELPHIQAWLARLKSRDAFRTHVMIPLT